MPSAHPTRTVLTALRIATVIVIMLTSRHACVRAWLRSQACLSRQLQTAMMPLPQRRCFRAAAASLSSGHDDSSEEWVKVDLATETERRRLNMAARINSAKRSAEPGEQRFSLDSEDSMELDRMLGLMNNKHVSRANMDPDLAIPQLNRVENRGASARRSSFGKGLKDEKNKLHAEKEAAEAKSDLPSKMVKGLLDMNPFLCSGCGTAFQSKKIDSPGFLPPEKFQEHLKQAEFIRKKQQAVKLLEMAGVELDSFAAEQMLSEANTAPEIIRAVRLFGQQSREEQNHSQKQTQKTNTDEATTEPIDASQLPVHPETVSGDSLLNGGACICQRCYRLQQYGHVDSTLRPGWSSNELLTPERFERLLSTVKEQEAVVLSIVDIFDLQGSVLKNLKQIAGNNPVVIAVNKLDLLPKDISHTRVAQWVYSEIRRLCDFSEPSNSLSSSRGRDAQGNSSSSKPGRFASSSAERGVLRSQNIHLMSCATDFGVREIVSKLMSIAGQHGSRVYVMGAANVGKSSFINKLLAPVGSSVNNAKGGKLSLQQQRKKNSQPLVTVSNLPGTTLDFLKIKLANGMTMIDTPGLINRGHLTSKLTTEELKQVIPSKPVNAVTLRVTEGRCVLMGGLARVDMLEGKPFHFTFFVSNEIKLHPTDSERAESFLQKHMGTLIYPPASVERLQELGPFASKEFTIEGDGWTQASVDIVLPGLGWIAVTGVGSVRVRVSAPEGTEVSLRPALLPFEAQHSTATFTGGKLVKKSNKKGTSKSYGWRA